MSPYSLLISRFDAEHICFYMCNYIYERDIDLCFLYRLLF